MTCIIIYQKWSILLLKDLVCIKWNYWNAYQIRYRSVQNFPEVRSRISWTFDLNRRNEINQKVHTAHESVIIINPAWCFLWERYCFILFMNEFYYMHNTHPSWSSWQIAILSWRKYQTDCVPKWLEAPSDKKKTQKVKTFSKVKRKKEISSLQCWNCVDRHRQ